jgi:hypothetical protein
MVVVSNHGLSSKMYELEDLSATRTMEQNLLFEWMNKCCFYSILSTQIQRNLPRFHHHPILLHCNASRPFHIVFSRWERALAPYHRRLCFDIRCSLKWEVQSISNRSSETWSLDWYCSSRNIFCHMCPISLLILPCFHFSNVPIAIYCLSSQGCKKSRIPM